MFQSKAVSRIRLGTSWIAVLALLMSMFVPFLVSTQSIGAAQVTSRSIDMNDSTPSATGVTYDFAFTVPSGSTVGSFVVEFCDNDPLTQTACTETGGTNVPDLDSASSVSAVFDDTGGTDECTPSLQSVTAGDNFLEWQCDVQENTLSGDGDFTASVSGIANHSSNGSFFARIYVFQATTAPDTTSPIDTSVDHEGGVALSLADAITLTARVQERLDFTVGADADGDDCGSISGTTIDLGILDNSNINRASTHPSGGNLDVICTAVTTNAGGGVVVSYTTTDLQVSGATCNETDVAIDSTELSTDQCLNYDDDSSLALVAGTEQWGIGIIDTPANGSNPTTNNFTIANADYDETVWSDTVHADPDPTVAGTPIALVNSGGNVVNDEAIEIDAAATANITTPTGVYNATLVFIATSTF